MNGVSVEQSLRFIFGASNNQVKYKALIASLKLAKELGVQKASYQMGLSTGCRPGQI